MSIVECVIVEQPSVSKTQPSSSPGGPYFLIALVAIVLGLVVLVFVRTSARRTSKR